VPATRRLVADDRGLPVRSEPVTGTAFDFSTGRQLGDSELDTAFTGLVASADGRVHVAVQRPDRRTPVSVWCGPPFKYVMVYTGDTLEPMSRRREGIAIEPMTCPPNALRTGEDLIVIEPHETWTATWGISP
jgi:aldose 1-epimerase